ncbi:hypothetical protein KFL_001810020 [Klebsormidium nitens]|uniref:SF3 helicase domain-containing protein n=1 Tax=Klebsormidium nitens TaxID=105231 RepID=A0A1Y1HZW0_KLENI|nr:hypothetical protein KFL_001810020 [Klebsormidium nitens]|eukprot:GAQ84220.1 hypothetical protein KFL_001810020 [Klebsormidium nitens]
MEGWGGASAEEGSGESLGDEMLSARSQDGTNSENSDDRNGIDDEPVEETTAQYSVFARRKRKHGQLDDSEDEPRRPENGAADTRGAGDRGDSAAGGRGGNSEPDTPDEGGSEGGAGGGAEHAPDGGSEGNAGGGSEHGGGSPDGGSEGDAGGGSEHGGGSPDEGSEGDPPDGDPPATPENEPGDGDAPLDLQGLRIKWGLVAPLTPEETFRLGDHFGVLTHWDNNTFTTGVRDCLAEVRRVESTTTRPEDKALIKELKRRIQQIRELMLGTIQCTQHQGNPLTSLISRFTEKCVREGFRRSEEKSSEVWKRVFIVTAPGICHDTRTFKSNTTILQELVAMKGDSDEVNDLCTEKLGLLGAAAMQIENITVDESFPVMVKNRSVFSFTNGIFVTDLKKDMCKPGARDRGRAEGEPPKEAFIPYEDVDRVLDDAVVSAKFHNAPLIYDEGGDETTVHHPVFDKLLRGEEGQNEDRDKGQRFSQDQMVWMLGFIGRSMTPIGVCDDWQTMPFLEGVPGTGKSLLLKYVIHKLYEEGDVGVVNNQSEKIFGLSSIADKFVWYCPEVKDDMNLDQSMFQSLVAGDSVSVAIKYQTAKVTTVTAHGWLAGNTGYPKCWNDPSGALRRRVAVFPFDYPVVTVDTKLGNKLEAELPQIILAAVRTYHRLLRELGSLSFDGLAIPDFVRSGNRLMTRLDPLRGYIEGRGLTIFANNINVYMPRDDLVTHLRQHLGINQTAIVSHPVWAEKGVVFISQTAPPLDMPYPRPNGANNTKREWVIGVDIKGANEETVAPQSGLPPQYRQTLEDACEAVREMYRRR